MSRCKSTLQRHLSIPTPKRVETERDEKSDFDYLKCNDRCGYIPHENPFPSIPHIRPLQDVHKAQSHNIPATAANAPASAIPTPKPETLTSVPTFPVAAAEVLELEPVEVDEPAGLEPEEAAGVEVRVLVTLAASAFTELTAPLALTIAEATLELWLPVAVLFTDSKEDRAADADDSSDEILDWRDGAAVAVKEEKRDEAAASSDDVKLENAEEAEEISEGKAEVQVLNWDEAETKAEDSAERIADPTDEASDPMEENIEPRSWAEDEAESARRRRGRVRTCIVWFGSAATQSSGAAEELRRWKSCFVIFSRDGKMEGESRFPLSVFCLLSSLLALLFSSESSVIMKMAALRAAVTLLAAASMARASPIQSSPQEPVFGLSDYYNTYRGVAAPYPGNETAPILPTTNGTAGPDDLLFQNLLAAEWAIFSFYQQGVERFNASSFTSAGLPNTTYDRIQEIRDNEAGHLAIFQSQISSNSIKPGACQYTYGVTDALSFIETLTILEIASMAFLTGLVQQAKTNATKGALVAIASTETRHEVWALLDLWKTNPFGGPSDTSFPYANEILDTTNTFIIPGSCPQENPPYPYPSQHLPQLSYNTTANLSPGSGSEVQFVFEGAAPEWNPAQQYYAVFFHGVLNVTVPFDVATNTTTIPDFETGKGLIIGVIADTEGAPCLESVVAGPLLLVQQPAGEIVSAV
ncbi:hypothetical protein B7494_g8386 [Chlorociboria aeruginascens]|nr:hypothetical protein B7494_g8386 [Chlorociboria aeruginascens]